jgi:hypothetical protein
VTYSIGELCSDLHALHSDGEKESAVLLSLSQDFSAMATALTRCAGQLDTDGSSYEKAIQHARRTSALLDNASNRLNLARLMVMEYCKEIAGSSG